MVTKHILKEENENMNIFFISKDNFFNLLKKVLKNIYIIVELKFDS
ncbi:hypothetical protein ES705_15705 [subsurface metagenome]